MNTAEFNSPNKPTWCPGCGNYAILLALKNALAERDCNPKDTVIVSGIGCSGKLPHFAKTYAYESLHGRALPVATGIKLTNHTLKVIAVGGDGDGYGIGMGHFIHCMRRNIDITYIVHNNQIYGLTTGQASPTSEKGAKTKSTPHGVIEIPINPISLAIATGATFVARGFSGDLKHLTSLFSQAIAHKGFSLVDVLQPCVIFNKINTYSFFQKNCYKLEEQNHNPEDKIAAFQKSLEWGEGKIPIGIFYRESRPTYEDELPTIQKTPLHRHDISNVNIERLLDEFE
ncbi:MAG: thiamine pyrophosphate-dependent enzyme [Candidatus Anstonellales archaeon]